MVDIIKYPYKNINTHEQIDMSSYIKYKNLYRKDYSDIIKKENKDLSNNNFFYKKMSLENTEELNLFNMSNNYNTYSLIREPGMIENKNTRNGSLLSGMEPGLINNSENKITKINKTPNTYPQISKVKETNINKENNLLRTIKTMRRLSY
jgi:hypothetical protein